jgi:hypothetical protein
VNTMPVRMRPCGVVGCACQIAVSPEALRSRLLMACLGRSAGVSWRRSRAIRTAGRGARGKSRMVDFRRVEVTGGRVGRLRARSTR